MNSIKPGGKIILLFLLLLFLILLPWVFRNPARVGMFISCGVASVLTMGWILILRIGCISLGQVAFLAIGGYTSALLVMKLGVNPWFGLFLGGMLSGLVALGIGLVVLRIRGLYLSIITFAFAEVTRLVLASWEFTGGHGGIMDIREFPPLYLPGLGAVKFNSPTSCYYIILAIALVSGIFIWCMEHSALGRTFKSLPQNEDLAESIGINPLHYKVISFVTACFFAGMAGAFTAHYYGCLYPGSYSPMQSIIVQIQGTVGGIGSVVFGGLLGGSLMVTIETFLLNVDVRLVSIFYGASIIIVTFLLPDGLLSLPGQLSRLWGRFKNVGS
jgi:branched-chain amino acid transport system permease protein